MIYKSSGSDKTKISFLFYRVMNWRATLTTGELDFHFDPVENGSVQIWFCCGGGRV